MILVDTSVWIDHLRNAECRLVDCLQANEILMHSMIIGELACGNLAQRDARLSDWHALKPIPELHNGDALALIESKKFMGRGIGLVDVHILGAVLNHPRTLLWTRDKCLHAITKELGVAFTE